MTTVANNKEMNFNIRNMIQDEHKETQLQLY